MKIELHVVVDDGDDAGLVRLARIADALAGLRVPAMMDFGKTAGHRLADAVTRELEIPAESETAPS